MKNPNYIRSLLCLAAISLATGHIEAQSYPDRFEALFKVKDTVQLKALLTSWETANPDDPELYTSAINFYFYTSRQEIVSLDKKTSGTGIQLTDSTGKIVG